MSNNFNNEYNTSVKDIAGLKDYTLIFNIFNAYFADSTSTDELVKEDNEFNIRTSKTRNKVNWAINKTLLRFVSKDHEELIQEVFENRVPLQDKKFALLWHLCVNNRLIREVTVNVFAKAYYSGRAQISQDDIIGYIKSISCKDDPNKPLWSEDTLYRLATKYLSLMTKFDFVTTGRLKTFNLIRPSTEAQILFLHFAKIFSPTISNILENELLPASFISNEDIQARLKKLALKDLFEMNFNGVALNVELTHSHKEICDALYNG